jgi:hypothetical protein
MILQTTEFNKGAKKNRDELGRGQGKQKDKFIVQ